MCQFPRRAFYFLLVVIVIRIVTGCGVRGVGAAAEQHHAGQRQPHDHRNRRCVKINLSCLALLRLVWVYFGTGANTSWSFISDKCFLIGVKHFHMYRHHPFLRIVPVYQLGVNRVCLTGNMLMSAGLPGIQYNVAFYFLCV